MQKPVIIGDVLPHRTDTAQQRVLRKRGETVGRVRRFHVDPANDTPYPRIDLRQREHELGFGLGGRGLDQHDTVNPSRLEERAGIGGKEISVDRQIRRHPVIIAAIDAPVMHMGVDRRHSPDQPFMAQVLPE